MEARDDAFSSPLELLGRFRIDNFEKRPGFLSLLEVLDRSDLMGVSINVLGSM